jgi:oxygen-independent coproporphyrinogen-3 oxidase
MMLNFLYKILFFKMNSLIDKYNIPGPRYTSYPTVPYWDESTFSPENGRRV